MMISSDTLATSPKIPLPASGLVMSSAVCEAGVVVTGAVVSGTELGVVDGTAIVVSAVDPHATTQSKAAESAAQREM